MFGAVLGDHVVLRIKPCSTFVSIFGPLPAQEDGFTAGPRRKASSAGWCQEWLKCFWNLKEAWSWAWSPSLESQLLRFS